MCGGLYGAASWENVLWFGVTDDNGNTDLQVAGDIGLSAVDLYNKMSLDRLSNDFSVTTCKVLYRPLTGDMVKSVTIADAVGTQDSGDQAAQVAYLINWVTSDYRRGGKPRTYVCGVPDDGVTGTVGVDSGYLGAINSGLADWISAIADGSNNEQNTQLELVEMSFRDAGSERETPVAFPVSGGILNPILATQRRRVDRLR